MKTIILTSIITVLTLIIILLTFKYKKELNKNITSTQYQYGIILNNDNTVTIQKIDDKHIVRIPIDSITDELIYLNKE